ncbi:hypothetical protein M9H77_23715 [Catharanthus roseus]|uniref:Uncharacterized protein n=1 Tax=Catharanthus roseus TaxID=4058 RepID=A0ACC0ATP8_CATRO|nr:hypothetical protein M9H77_23715 [Catharanthus roseus]
MTLTSRRCPHPSAANLQTLHEQSTPIAPPLRTSDPLCGSVAAQMPQAAPTHRTSVGALSGDNKSDSGNDDEETIELVLNESLSSKADSNLLNVSKDEDDEDNVEE